LAGRPPPEPHLTSTGEDEREQREGESSYLFCDGRERKTNGK